MDKEWDMIEVLRHARHDWLNKLQLIKGNLALDKIDRAKEIIDEIVLESQQEAKLSNLKIPLFASLLLTYNWENHFFQLEYDVLEVDGNSCIKQLDDKALAQWTSTFFECLNASVKPYYENHLSVSIEPQSEAARFFFDFSGIIVDKSMLNEFFTSIPNFLSVHLHEFSDMELGLEVFVPFSMENKK
ncbi:Spo0B C-terminal domain-containing protein [Cytobacillus gottheilii]|uniref:Sporulation protein n=2 Tax=Bacillaceae TaxID=186817 RepID=A0A7V7UZE8_9BACI|nr:MULTISPECIES: sporulation initiation phosphotransferase B [Bacillaceae]KAB2334067.1 sporulation protein [Bacillus mesophilum]QVY60525.1 sporulation initiation phosphotransferase B [Cytobacillus gottheilii]